MCGRFVQHADPEIYASRYDAEVLQALPARTGQGYNVAPTQRVLAVRTADGRERELAPLRWGLVPHWSKGPDERYSMINARAETVHSKPAYRDAFRRRRCLIPAEGFYEWRAARGGKQPYLMRRDDGEPFVMAGLWETWSPDDGAQPLESCTIIVTDANDLIAPVHDRMPVILGDADLDAWLDPANQDSDALQALLRPAPTGGWRLHPVSKVVNSPRNDSPDLIEPVPEPPPPAAG